MLFSFMARKTACTSFRSTAKIQPYLLYLIVGLIPNEGMCVQKAQKIFSVQQLQGKTRHL